MSLGRNNTYVLKQPRKVYIVVGTAEQELGYTFGGIRFTISDETYMIETDQIGPLDEIIKKYELTIVTPFLQWHPELLAKLVPGSNLVEDGTEAGTYKLEIGTCTGLSLRTYAVPLILRPESKSAGENEDDIKLWLASPTGSREVSFGQEGSKEVTEVTWKSFPVTTAGYTTTNNLCVIGDPAITA